MTIGKKLKYYAQHNSLDTFNILEYLEILNCNTKSSSIREFKTFNEVILNSANNSSYSRKAKALATAFFSSGYDVLKGEKFNEYWIKKDKKNTRSAMHGAQAAVNRQQAESYEELMQNLNDGDNEDTGPEEQGEEKDVCSDDNLNNITISSQGSSTSYVTGDTHSSADSQPVKDKLHKYYLVTTEGDYEFVLNDESRRWILADGTDISQQFINFRDIAVGKAEDLEKLDLYEEVSLNGIMLVDDEICDERYVNFENVEAFLSEIEKERYFKRGTVSKEEAIICDLLAEAMKSRKTDYGFVNDEVEDWYYKNKSTDHRKLQTFLSNMINTHSTNYKAKKVNEATLVRDTIDNALKAYFKNTPIMSCLGADTMIESSSERFTDLDPSLANYGKRADYSIVSHRYSRLLLSLEAKRIGNVISGDLIKLGRQMKESLKDMTADGYTNAPVCGLLLKGSTCGVYVMDHKFDGLYRMVLIEQLHMPLTRYNLESLRPIAAAIKMLSLVVSNSARVVNKSHPDEENLPQNTVSIHRPINVNRIKKLNLETSRVKRAKRKLIFEKEKEICIENDCPRE